MDKLTLKERLWLLRCCGYNPIHLCGNLYLVRKQTTMLSDWPIYKIEKIKE